MRASVVAVACFLLPALARAGRPVPGSSTSPAASAPAPVSARAGAPPLRGFGAASTSSTALTATSSAASASDEAGAEAPPSSAPPADEASGRVRSPEPEPAPAASKALLLLPRGLAFVLFLPVRGALYAFDAGDLRARFESIFFNRERTFGAFPIVRIETPFGVSFGGTVIHRDLFGHSEQLSLTAAFGGRVTSSVDLGFDTGQLLGRRDRVELRFTYDGQPDLRFYGVGNVGRVVGADAISEPLDPYSAEVAVESATFRDRVVLDLTPVHELDGRIELRARFAWAWQDVSERDLDATPVSVRDVYRVEGIPYYDRPFSTLIGELEVRYDSLHVTNPVLPPSTQSSGVFARAFIGANQVVGRTDSFYFRGGLDLRRYIDLFAGTRVLVLRAHGEAVSAPVEEVPILDLPGLGGPFNLRGYRRGRFRDQALWLTSAEYRFPIISVLSGFVFVDVGRVFSDPSEALNDPQVGFGGGVELSASDRRLARLQVGGSRLGTVVFNFEIGLDLPGPDWLRDRW